MSSAGRLSWSAAFLAQAASDLDVYYQLTGSALPQCQRLHALQMWLEKLCKAFMYKSNSDEFRPSHNVVAKVLPTLIRDRWSRIGFEGEPRIAEIRALCREIDLLQPQVNDEGRRPDNVEYPWLGLDGRVEAPVHWKFTIAARLATNSGRQLLKASDRLTRNPANLV